MKKVVLLVLLMFAIPVQSVWAGMSAYAHHGEGEEVHHAAGHQHQHKHKHLPDSPDNGSGKLHHHCGFAHSAGVALVADFGMLPGTSSVQAVFAYRAILHPTPVPQRPERPNWRSASA